MEMQELEITIGKDGRVQIGVRGVRGEGCLALTKRIEDAIGSVEDRTLSAEYYEQPVEITTHHQIGIR